MSQWIWIVVVMAALLAALALLLVALRNWRRQGGRKGHRLGVLERMPIARDAELVLLRRDNVEHLVCLTGNGGFLVEGGIRRQRARREPAGGAVGGAGGEPVARAPAPHAEPKVAPTAAAAPAASSAGVPPRKEPAPPPPPPPGAAARAPRPARKEPAAPEKANSAEAGPGGEGK